MGVLGAGRDAESPSLVPKSILETIACHRKIPLHPKQGMGVVSIMFFMAINSLSPVVKGRIHGVGRQCLRGGKNLRKQPRASRRLHEE
uniref:Uncharacterized protein n=1 Tax=Candidatus Kentrum eta TaxID=2126337 RepID=A0A450UGT4_9GAMM|nr:MAG: hypothetical protein BECKH772A_GA0070896_1003410 [Candidatus Kentron sp. H]VFJ92954.1 MAG: hypothetical protein BECKH772B_GA0070898_1003610 [Candidatus Kentron sp. H]VFJ99565.1 MAG: hypothetical protein BECKH772C_GA0070978_1003310 [Candidatus Kentron sp. H]